MMGNYRFVHSEPLTANTLCVVGVCTCLIMKMAVERTFEEIGIEDYDVQPATGDNPMGSRNEYPDVIFCETVIEEEIRSKVYGSLIVPIEDVADQQDITDRIIEYFKNENWLIEE